MGTGSAVSGAGWPEAQCVEGGGIWPKLLLSQDGIKVVIGIEESALSFRDAH